MQEVSRPRPRPPPPRPRPGPDRRRVTLPRARDWPPRVPPRPGGAPAESREGLCKELWPSWPGSHKSMENTIWALRVSLVTLLLNVFDHNRHTLDAMFSSDRGKDMLK